MYEIAYWNLGTNNVLEAEKFYRTLFGWKIGENPEWPDYATIGIGDKAMVAGMGKTERSGTTLYVHVPDVGEWLNKAVALGSSVSIPRTVLPDNMGVFATFMAPDGTAIGLWSEK